MAKTAKKEYEYSAQYIRALDGDTWEFFLDLGFSIYHRIQVRVVGADAPEVTGVTKEEGLRVSAYTDEILRNAKEIVIHTQHNRSFTRWLGYVYVDGMDLAKHLIEEGMGVVTHAGWKDDTEYYVGE